MEAIAQIQHEICALPLTEGANKTGIPFVTAWYFTSHKIEMPKTENPYLYIVVDGTLRLYTPSGIMDYMEGQYSISKIDTPLSGSVLTFSPQKSFLALSVEFTVNDVISCALNLDNDLRNRIMGQNMEEQEMSASDGAVIESIYRLFRIKQPVGSEFLRKNMMQEVIYYVLCGSCGKQFLQGIAHIAQADEIYEANSWIKENFRSSFTVEKLAEQRNMSVSLFHQKFKSAVGMGPLPGKAYTAAVTQCKTKDVAAAAAEGASLMAIQTNDPRITLVAGGYPLFADRKIVGGIGVGGGTEEQDCKIAEYVVSVFEKLTD